MNRCSVAQVANLLYRRLPIGEALELLTDSGLAICDTAQRGIAAIKSFSFSSSIAPITMMRTTTRTRDSREPRRFRQILIDRLSAP